MDLAYFFFYIEYWKKILSQETIIRQLPIYQYLNNFNVA